VEALHPQRERAIHKHRIEVKATAEIVWTNSPEGEMRGPQSGWSGFTGQTEAEYQGFGWAEAVHPEDAQPTVDAWNLAVAARRSFLFEHRVRRHDGVYRTFAIRAVAILNEDGTIREWVGIHTDVTERRAMEAAREALLAQQGVFLRDVLSSVTEGKLLLSTSPAQLPAPLLLVGKAISLTQEGGLRALRLRAQEAADGAGHSEERQFDLITAVSEAGMNGHPARGRRNGSGVRRGQGDGPGASRRPGGRDRHGELAARDAVTGLQHEGDAGARAEDDDRDGGPSLSFDGAERDHYRSGAGAGQATSCLAVTP